MSNTATASGNSSFYEMSAAATYRDYAHQTGALTNQPFILDKMVQCTPQEFSEEWTALPNTGLGFSCLTQHSPLLMEVVAHLKERGFFVIASGVVDEGTMKLYVLGQAQGVRCLLEVGFIFGEQRLSIMLRCREEGEVNVFVKCLNLKKLFGDFVDVEGM